MDPTEERDAAFAHALVPVWLLPLPVAAWAWLAMATGGEDMTMWAWLVPVAQAVVHPAGAVLAGVVLLGCLMGIVGVGGRTQGLAQQHAGAALRDALLVMPVLFATPWALGWVARVDPATLSMVADGAVVGSEAGSVARGVAGVLMAGLLLALPPVGRWTSQLGRAVGSKPPLPLAKYERPWWGLVALFAGWVVLATWGL